ncbi:DUF2939 domain-containing protein [Microbulbifer sp.]|uniref:DUF2939 domain-containing protein n=1 Tax=Microbulbifer sp. TaxID=1908541 RepID=UPI002F92DB3B
MGKWTLRAVLLVILLGLVYAALPWYSAHKLVEAAQEQDLETMERYVDFPQLRANIRGRLLDDVRISMGQDLSPELGSIFSAGAELFLGPLIDSLISPRGISELIQGQKDWKEFERELEGAFGRDRRSPPPSVPAPEPSPEDEDQHRWQLQHWRFSGLNTVEVLCGNRGEKSRVQLFLQRNGLRWQLVDMRLIDEQGE